MIDYTHRESIVGLLAVPPAEIGFVVLKKASYRLDFPLIPLPIILKLVNYVFCRIA